MNLRTLFTITALTSATLVYSSVGAEPLTSVAKPYDSTHLLPGERMFVGAERDVALLKTATAAREVEIALCRRISSRIWVNAPACCALVAKPF